MSPQEQLALAQHVLASQAQGLVSLAWLQREGETIAVPRAWIERWIAQSREALCLLRRDRSPQTAGREARREETRMPTSIFRTLCALCDDLDRAVHTLEPGPTQDRFAALVQRLDETIDRTVGLEQPMTQEESD
jgi:hypothetical protein